jgi:hypothetical protein
MSSVPISNSHFEFPHFEFPRKIPQVNRREATPQIFSPKQEIAGYLCISEDKCRRKEFKSGFNSSRFRAFAFSRSFLLHYAKLCRYLWQRRGLWFFLADDGCDKLRQ